MAISIPLGRVLRHLYCRRRHLRRALPRRARRALRDAIRESEKTHSGEIHVALEASLDSRRVWRGETPRERALEVFSRLRVWDTERNNGVLIYLLLADRSVEIIADRGIHSRVGPGHWEMICRTMESQFRDGQFEAGLLYGIQTVGDCLIQHFPGADTEGNELPDQPSIL